MPEIRCYGGSTLIDHGLVEVDWLVNTHAHPLDIVFVRLCGFVPMYALGLAQPLAERRLDIVPLLIMLLGTMWGFFIHANVGWIDVHYPHSFQRLPSLVGGESRINSGARLFASVPAWCLRWSVEIAGFVCCHEQQDSTPAYEL